MFLRRAPVLVWLFALAAGCGSGEPPLESASALETLGVTEADAERLAVDSLISGQAYGLISSAGRAFKALPDEQRVMVIEAMAAWTRSYLASDAFRDAYAQYRARSMPVPVDHEESVDEALARRTAEGLSQLEEMRRTVLPQLSEADRQEMLEGLAAMEKQLADPAYTDLQRQSIEMERAGEASEYEASLRYWNDQFPENPQALVARRLKELVGTCADVDFDARLEERYGLLRFVNEDYERKPDLWKLCYRAGEQSVETARESARAWLDDLG